jgi:transcriptional regulator with XRE-family HTH domain
MQNRQGQFEHFSKNSPMTFGERLRKFRKENKLRQSDLAAVMGFTANTIVSRFERGEAFPSADKLANLARKYPVDLHWLITGEDSPGQQEAERHLYEHLVREMLPVVRSLQSLFLERDRLESALATCIERKAQGLPADEEDPHYDAFLRREIASTNAMIEEAKQQDEWIRGMINALEKKHRDRPEKKSQESSE